MPQKPDWDYISRDSEGHPDGRLPERELLDCLWDSARILEQYGVLSKFGHVSVRSKYESIWFYLLRGGDADTVKKQATYEIHAGQPVPDSVPLNPWSEHYIHASLYKQYPDIGAVIHSHSSDVLPFAVKKDTQSDLRAVIHMAGFLGNGPKIFDPGAEASISSNSYSANFLVNSYDIARGLTECFAQSGEDEPDGHAAIALQTAHRSTAVGKDLAEVVYRAIYTQENARVLMQAKALYREEIRFFYPENVRACLKMNENAAEKAFMGWRLDLPSRR